MFIQKYCKAFSHLVFICLLVACNASTSADEVTCSKNSQQFWHTFRGAVLQSNIKEVSNLTHFPFIISGGITDAERKNKETSREEFINLYPHFLTKDPGLSLQPSTMWDLITATENLKPAYCSSDGKQFRIGDWVFQVKTGTWQFVKIYLEDE